MMENTSTLATTTLRTAPDGRRYVEPNEAIFEIDDFTVVTELEVFVAALETALENRDNWMRRQGDEEIANASALSNDDGAGVRANGENSAPTNEKVIAYKGVDYALTYHRRVPHCGANRKNERTAAVAEKELGGAPHAMPTAEPEGDEEAKVTLAPPSLNEDESAEVSDDDDAETAAATQQPLEHLMLAAREIYDWRRDFADGTSIIETQVGGYLAARLGPIARFLVWRQLGVPRTCATR